MIFKIMITTMKVLKYVSLKLELTKSKTCTNLSSEFRRYTDLLIQTYLYRLILSINTKESTNKIAAIN